MDKIISKTKYVEDRVVGSTILPYTWVTETGTRDGEYYVSVGGSYEVEFELIPTDMFKTGDIFNT